MARTLAERICQTIRDEIIEGKLNHQDFLTEGGLAERFSVSKAPVRDAFHRLCQEGYLVSYPRKGYMINILTAGEIDQIQEVRAHLEQMSVKLAIQKATDAEIDSLAEIIAVDGHEAQR
jgi:DNA-binding GntR family transcriptional regulator